MLRRANPDRETADWRAVCGRTACTVRRAGRTWVLPDPYPWHKTASWLAEIEGSFMTAMEKSGHPGLTRSYADSQIRCGLSQL
jgi:hypothetical protein